MDRAADFGNAEGPVFLIDYYNLRPHAISLIGDF
jgi:hypothetical protein